MKKLLLLMSLALLFSCGNSETSHISIESTEEHKGPSSYYDPQAVDLTKDNIEAKIEIGYLPSEVSFYEDLTIKEMLDFHEEFYKKDTSKRRKELVELLELDETKKIEDLSLGNNKKLGIVLAFMHEPKLLILDEPTSGLDPIMQQRFYDLLKQEKEKGTTIFYSTHILTEISKVCDRVGIIKEGKLLSIESIKDLLSKNLNNITIESDEIENIIKELDIKEYKKMNTR